jgi:hypothetical protein
MSWMKALERATQVARVSTRVGEAHKVETVTVPRVWNGEERFTSTKSAGMEVPASSAGSGCSRAVNNCLEFGMGTSSALIPSS